AKRKPAGACLLHGLLAGGAPPARLDRGPARVVAWRLARLAVTSAPVRQQAQRAGELVTGGGELVDEALRACAVRLREHETLRLQAPEPLCEHVRRDARELLLEVAEPAWPVEERLHEQERPAVAHAVERRGQRGGGWLGGWLCHAEIVAVYSDLQFASNTGALRMSTVTTVQHAIAGAAERVGPSVVGLGRGWGHGSGSVIADGHVLTSAHNLRRDEVTVVFSDGRREAATVAGLDTDNDLAVLAVDTGDAPAIAWEPQGGTSAGEDTGDVRAQAVGGELG